MPTKTAATAKSPKTSAADRLEKLKKRLLEKRDELVQDLAKNREISDETVDESAQDMADRATSAYTKEFAYSLSEADRKTLVLIDEALKRIEAGTYGICLHSGVPIEEKRLDAVPWAPYCLEVQEMKDKGLI